MKLIFAIVGSDDSGAVQDALTQSGFMVTKMSSTGGFLRAGNVTFMIGIDDNKVDDVIEVISQYCRKRTQVMPGVSPYGGDFDAPIQVTAGGATIFVTNVSRFEKL